MPAKYVDMLLAFIKQAAGGPVQQQVRWSKAQVISDLKKATVGQHLHLLNSSHNKFSR
jgi:hypothetical protein